MKEINELMKKTMLAKKLKRALSVVMVMAILMGSVSMPTAQATGFGASYIQKLDNIASNYEQYLDSSVMFELPDGIGDNDEISVIVTVDVVNVMDAYEGTDKTMSLSEYALNSDDAAEIKEKITLEKNKVLDELNKKEISYTVGEEYSTVLSGFELVIKAGDFETTCKSLGEGMDVIVGEVYETCKTELVENEVNHYYYTIPGDHNMDVWKNGLYNFLKIVFK